MKIYFKINVIVFICINIFSTHGFSEPSVIVDKLKTLEAETKNQQQVQAEELRRLEDEKERLRNRLQETEGKITEIQSSQQNTKPAEYVLNSEAIHQIMTTKKMEFCTITPGDHEGEYFISKKNIKIRFVFLNKDEKLSPKSSLIKDEQGQSLVQIEQPGYNPTNTSEAGDMYALIKQNLTNSEIVHAVFHGQRIGDKWFGRSSYDITVVTCQFGPKF